MAFQIAQHTQEIMMTLVSQIGNEIMQMKKNESNLTVSRFGILEKTLSLFLLLRWCLTERHWGTWDQSMLRPVIMPKPLGKKKTFLMSTKVMVRNTILNALLLIACLLMADVYSSEFRNTMAELRIF